MVACPAYSARICDGYNAGMAHASQEELAARVAAAAEDVTVGGRYVHFKDPTRQYEVTALAIMEADESVAVVYRALYDDGISFVRPLASFTALVEADGRSVSRFTKVS